MRKEDMLVMLSKKEIFIRALEAALQVDERSEVDSICYNLDFAARDEIITIIFKGGGIKRILATGNSNGANAKEIIKAVYGK